MRHLPLALITLTLAIAGCPSTTEGLDASDDAGGVCCEPSPSPCTRPTIGGWASSAAACPGPIESFDGRWNRETDAHGCEYWDDVTFGGGPSSDVCCGCFDPDAGVDDAPPADDAPPSTFDCGGTACSTADLCVGRFDRSVDGGPVHTAECVPRPASCAAIDDCMPGACTGYAACIAEVCMTPASLVSISGSTLECGT